LSHIRHLFDVTYDLRGFVFEFGAREKRQICQQLAFSVFGKEISGCVRGASASENSISKK